MGAKEVRYTSQTHTALGRRVLSRTRTNSSESISPKKANFGDFSDSKIMKIQKKINRRPREKINFDSPKDRFFKHFY